MDPIFDQFLEVSDILEFLERDNVMNESLFEYLVLKRPKIMIKTLKQISSKESKVGVSVEHVFVNHRHNLFFQLRINLLMKLIQSLGQFEGSLTEAKELTNLLICLGSDFTLNAGQYDNFTKLFFHNIAHNMCSIDDRIEWQFKYIWFLAKKQEFQKMVFKELPDYWSGSALPTLNRINPLLKTTEEKTRKFVIILLISGNFPNFQKELKPNCLEVLDRHSLQLLLYFGFDFNKCLKTYYDINETIDENTEPLISKNPKLMKFLIDVEYFEKPLKLKHQVRIHYRYQWGNCLDKMAKQLSSRGLIPKHVCDFLRYKLFVQF